MTVLDDRLRPLAKDLIEKYGKLIDVLVDAKSYDPTTGEATVTTKSYSVKVTPPQNYENGMIDGDLIRRGDTQAYIAAKDLSFLPEAGISLMIDGIRWGVVSVENVFSGELICIFGVQLRR